MVSTISRQHHAHLESTKVGASGSCGYSAFPWAVIVDPLGVIMGPLGILVAHWGA